MSVKLIIVRYHIPVSIVLMKVLTFASSFEQPQKNAADLKLRRSQSGQITWIALGHSTVPRVTSVGSVGFPQPPRFGIPMDQALQLPEGTPTKLGYHRVEPWPENYTPTDGSWMLGPKWQPCLGSLAHKASPADSSCKPHPPSNCPGSKGCSPKKKCQRKSHRHPWKNSKLHQPMRRDDAPQVRHHVWRVDHPCLFLRLSSCDGTWRP